MNTNQLARVGLLIGEPARTAMLVALLDGRALTAGELASASRVTAATASRHLGLLLEAQLLQVRQQGRHRYYQLASADVARLLESMMQVAGQAHVAGRPVRTGPREAALRFARTCYDHLAGRLGVALCEHLVHEGALRIEEDTAALTDRADRVLARLGFDAVPTSKGKDGPPLACRPCLDWGERRMHLAGRFGAMLCAHTLQQGWLLRRPPSRALQLTPAGAQALRNALGTQRWNSITTG